MFTVNQYMDQNLLKSKAGNHPFESVRSVKNPFTCMLIRFHSNPCEASGPGIMVGIRLYFGNRIYSLLLYVEVSMTWSTGLATRVQRAPRVTVRAVTFGARL